MIRAALALMLVAGPALATEIGDADKGASVFRKCASCHQVGSDASDRTGPHLNGIFGRPAAAHEGFDYSRSMARAGADGLIWDLNSLDTYLENPKSLVSGTRMNFRGLKQPEDRADVLAFLRLYSDNPQNIPEAEPTARASDPDVQPEILALKGDLEYGAYLSSECTTCHQADGDDAGIPSITGWAEEDFVVAMHAYKVKHRVHPVMQMMAGRLSDEEIAARKEQWVAPALKHKKGILYKYAKMVASASKGCVTDAF